MTGWSLIRRSLRFYWRTHLGIVLGSAVATGVLAGALMVGDSIRYTLDAAATARLGTVQLAMAPQGRFFRAKLAADLAADLDAPTAAVLQVPGVLSRPDGSSRANNVQVLGVDERFWKLGGGGGGFLNVGPDEVILNERAAGQLGVRAGGQVVLRVHDPGLLPREAALPGGRKSAQGFTLTVKAIAGDSQFGRFGLRANQVPPYNAFVSLRWLAESVKLPGRANIVLIGGADKTAVTVAAANEAVRRQWRLADAGLEVRPLRSQGTVELRSDRIFIDPAAAEAAVRARPDATGILTYLVNELRIGERATPYSMVAAIGAASQSAAAPPAEGVRGLLPADVRDDEIVINSWLARDLAAREGDEIELTYFVLTPTGKLEETSRRFGVRAIVPLEGPAADRSLMPEFPGLANVKNPRDWKTDLPIDLTRIRDKDEDYWDAHRGTPKAFVTLIAGRRMWANRFGDVTALRFPSTQATEQAAATLEQAIRRQLDPSVVGLFFEPVRERAQAAARESQDFGRLFLGFSVFLIVACVLLTGLLFAFGVEQRTGQIGTFLAVGFSRRRVRWLLLGEGGVLAVIGGAVGTGGGVLYTRAMLRGLLTVWPGTVGTSMLTFHASPMTLAIGALGGVAVAMAAILAALRRLATRPTRELLAGQAWASPGAGLARGRNLGVWVAIVAGVGAAVCLGVMGVGGVGAAAAFFAAGALLLAAGLSLSAVLLRFLSRRGPARRMTLAGVGFRNAVRRRGRSLATVGLLACGSFLVVAVGANRRDGGADLRVRSSPAGGFALFAESALPVYRDLNSAGGRKAFAMSAETMHGVGILSLRVRRGDDASCLNPNRPQTPRLLGVRPAELQSRGAFTFVETAEGMQPGQGWSLLEKELPDGSVPAVADRNTIAWAMGKSVGETLAYTDERGRAMRIRLVGAIAGSILQGNVIISERNFLRGFPSESGYRMFLIDTPAGREEAVAGELSSAMQDVGMEVTATRRRLAEFNAVENTYLSIFQALGGLGLLLGSVGLALVVQRNVLERRGELALLRAVGFSRRSLGRMVLAEHWGLLVIGLACGVAAALLAVAPVLAAPGANVPYVSLAITLLAVLVNGAVWAYLAARWALRGPLLAALRNE